MTIDNGILLEQKKKEFEKLIIEILNYSSKKAFTFIYENNYVCVAIEAFQGWKYLHVNKYLIRFTRFENSYIIFPETLNLIQELATEIISLYEKEEE